MNQSENDEKAKKSLGATATATITGASSSAIIPDHSKSNGGSIPIPVLLGGARQPHGCTKPSDISTTTSMTATVSDNEDSQATAANLGDESGDEYSSQQSTATHDPGKMFVGGLSWQTTAEGLRDYFCKFGDVNECMVMRDPTTKRARGFGFITFADPNTVYKVLEQKVHELDGKQIDPKIAFPKKAQPKTKKVFIGGLSANSTVEDIKAYFQQFGKIEDAMLMYDKATQRHRGFGFITFDDDEVSDKVCEIHFHEINGKMVECKKAQPKEVMLPVQMNKSRAAAARNLYGLAPEQLLAYTSLMPRISPYPPMVSPQLYPGVFNGFSPQSTAFGISPSGRSSVSNSGPLSSTGSSGLVNPREFAAHLAAQQQAVYDAIAFASMGGGAAGDFSAFHHHHPNNTGNHQLISSHQQNMTAPSHHHHHLTSHPGAAHGPHQSLSNLHQTAAAMAMAMHHQQPPPTFGK